MSHSKRAALLEVGELSIGMSIKVFDTSSTHSSLLCATGGAGPGAKA